MIWDPRNSRVDLPGGPFCDKAWHEPSTASAVAVLRCASCGVVYARCEQCEKYRPGNAAASMRAHVLVAHQSNRDLKKRIMPNEDI